MSVDDADDTKGGDDDVFDFDEQLGVAAKWERLLEPVLGGLVWEEAQRISFNDNPGMQLAGIDHVLKEREFKDDALQTKVITRNYDNIFYETRHEDYHDPSKEWDGWVYEYDERVILWVWLSDSQNRIVDASWLLVNDDFRMWFNHVKTDYPEKRAGKPSYRDGRKWWSFGVPIPLSDIRRRFIRPAHTAVGIKSNTDQTELLEFDSDGVGEPVEELQFERDDFEWIGDREGA